MEKLGTDIRRLSITIQGAVQGVGFRPFIFRRADSLGLRGWVVNSAQGVMIEAEGDAARLEKFLLSIEKDKPKIAYIQSLEFSYLEPAGYLLFEIRKSDPGGSKTAMILPDIATCPECLSEIFDPQNRRYLYPFTNCTNCGPRFSIIQSLPYDRPGTSMAGFTMCARCQAEYDDPEDRRFHAQPNACPDCGPSLTLWDLDGQGVAHHQEALMRAADAIREGLIVAVKGIGGFHLMADARNEEAVRTLRLRKHREAKPLAMMFPSLAALEETCHVDELEARLLTSPESPIVLLRRLPEDGNSGNRPAASVAPGNPYFGVMLPYSPLHHLLMARLDFPVIATSGNLSEEPICIDETDALVRLKHIADFFLVHNRPIVRHVDDSIACIRMRRQQVFRRARGFAPLPVRIDSSGKCSLAVGAHLKNTIALSVKNNGFVSQHIGDLETLGSFKAFETVINDFERLYDATPDVVACDAHPGYMSTKYAKDTGRLVVPVQHHYAHILSCMAENQIHPPVLGIAWDGTGYGPDGTVWGGEFLKIKNGSFSRLAHWRTFPLPGGDKAVKEPRRSAFGLLYEIFGEELFDLSPLHPLMAFTDAERQSLRVVLKKNINTFRTSSVGRLFDAVASIINIHQNAQFEGQAAMALEFLIEGTTIPDAYPVGIMPHDASTGMPLTVDWEPMIRQIMEEANQQVPLAVISAGFHNSLAEAAVQVARMSGERRVVLSGGCFQNGYLTEQMVKRLSEAGFEVFWHQRIPTNDGGIALGQVVAASLL
ncbi:MAG: carbamoyltransferase HypF [Desulfobacteraceae bacterium]|nr:MAG: carbamoyltransferase HypF [Desulfobacteraceae bacterium]